MSINVNHNVSDHFTQMICLFLDAYSGTTTFDLSLDVPINISLEVLGVGNFNNSAPA